MNSGIYALYWWEQDLVYVGLSQNLDQRKKEHLRMLKSSTHTNYKVQNAYNTYGVPEFIVLEYCSLQELPDKEVYWCNEFDALGKNGLCLVEPGVVGFGVNSNSSKYTKFQILKVFSLLYKGVLPNPVIAKQCGVDVSLVHGICRGLCHLWLKSEYPDKYQKMISLDRRDISFGFELKGILQHRVTGKVYHVYNAAKFCKENPELNLRANKLNEVLAKSRISHRDLILCSS